MKGRNSVVVGIRLSDSVYTILKERAKGLTVGEYIKSQILKSLNHSAITTKLLQLYNPTIHKSGDKVLISKGKRLVEAVVPVIDADGHPIFD